MSRVSIIIPCFNDGAYLMEAVASAKAQTYADKEIIVVNDHSDCSSTLECLSKLKDEGVTVLNTPKGRKGLPAARNTGISASTGEYILPLDADDLIAPTYIAKAVDVLKNNPEVALCYCRARMFDLVNKELALPDYSWERLLLGNVIFATSLYRRKDWEDFGGYDECLRIGLEDYSLWLKILEGGRRAHRLNEVLFYYRIRPNSMSVAMELENKAEAALAVFNSNRELFIRNIDTLFVQMLRMRNAHSWYNRFLSWKLLSPLLKLERRIRRFRNRLRGR